MRFNLPQTKINRSPGFQVAFFASAHPPWVGVGAARGQTLEGQLSSRGQGQGPGCLCRPRGPAESHGARTNRPRVPSPEALCKDPWLLGPKGRRRETTRTFTKKILSFLPSALDSESPLNVRGAGSPVAVGPAQAGGGQRPEGQLHLPGQGWGQIPPSLLPAWAPVSLPPGWPFRSD